MGGIRTKIVRSCWGDVAKNVDLRNLNIHEDLCVYSPILF